MLKQMDKIIFFDLETTGVNVTKDRIVEIGVKKVNSDLTEFEPVKKYRFNPEVPISDEAIACHGITNEMVANEPFFKQRAAGLFEYISDCYIAGYNVINFDIPLLSEEFARCGIEWPQSEIKVIDPCIIFREKEKRDLTGACKFYLNETLEGAHAAEADVEATFKVFKAMLTKYEFQSLDSVVDFCKGEYPPIDLAGKIVLKDGVAVYGFGKDKHKPVKENPGFGKWMLGQDFPTNTKKVLISIIG